MHAMSPVARPHLILTRSGLMKCLKPYFLKVELIYQFYTHKTFCLSIAIPCQDYLYAQDCMVSYGSHIGNLLCKYTHSQAQKQRL